MSEEGSSQPDTERLREFALRRDELDPFLVRQALAVALRHRGFASIVWSDDGSDAIKSEGRGAAIVSLIVIWGYGIWLTALLGLPWFLAPISFVGVLLVSSTLTKSKPGSVLLALLVTVGWLSAALTEAIDGSFFIFVAAFLAPTALGLAYAVANRLLRLRDAQDVALALAGASKSVPLVAPVVLLVLFLPALSEDVWRVAGGLSVGELGLLGLASVGLLLVSVRLQLGSQVGPMIASRAEHLNDLRERSELTRKQLNQAGSEDGMNLFEGITDEQLDSYWPVAGEEYAPYMRAAVGKSLQAPLSGRLAVTVGAVAVLFSAYIYLLCSTAVSIDTAAQWSKVATPSTVLHLFGFNIEVAGGPYLSLSALLGLAATATFLSFALVEDRFAAALTDALLRDPTDRYLALALPYVSLCETAIELGRRQQAETDPAAPPAEERS